MRIKLCKCLAVAAAIIGLAATVQATEIRGSIGFGIVYVANGIADNGDLSTATSMTISSPFVAFAKGDLAGATAPVSFASPIGVNGNGPLIGQLWSVNVGGTTFTFDVTTQFQVLTSATQINLVGMGMMRNGTPADDTVGQWQLTFGGSGTKNDGAFTWQSTTATVPDGGTTALLLGAALSGLALIRRKLA